MGSGFISIAFGQSRRVDSCSGFLECLLNLALSPEAPAGRTAWPWGALSAALCCCEMGVCVGGGATLAVLKARKGPCPQQGWLEGTLGPPRGQGRTCGRRSATHKTPAFLSATPGRSLRRERRGSLRSELVLRGSLQPACWNAVCPPAPPGAWPLSGLCRRRLAAKRVTSGAGLA